MNGLKMLVLILASTAAGRAETPLSAWVKPGRTEVVTGKKRAFLKEPATMTVVMPAAVTTLEELKRINPQLPAVLPGLPALLASAKVSPKFNELYDRKVRILKRGTLMSDEDFFDCATVLNLTAGSGRHALLLQSDMDVVTDGSDPDRLARIEQYDVGSLDDDFQPMVGYYWEGKPNTRNPFLDYYPREIAAIDGFAAHFKALINGNPQEKLPGDKCVAWRKLLAVCKSQSESLTELYRKYAKDMLGGHSLVPELDPFVVLPGGWIAKSDKAAGDDPNQVYFGDYVAVIYKGSVYPAIVGDAGPDFKTGEASLKMARAIRPTASGNLSAVDGAGVTYLVFPGTHEPRGEPNLEHIREQVSKLLDESGGAGVELHKW